MRKPDRKDAFTRVKGIFYFNGNKISKDSLLCDLNYYYDTYYSKPQFKGKSNGPRKRNERSIR